jgi:hypothetical protein
MHNLPDLPTLAAFAAHRHATVQLADTDPATRTLVHGELRGCAIWRVPAVAPEAPD